MANKLIYSLDITKKYHNVYNVTDLYKSLVHETKTDISIIEVDAIIDNYNDSDILKSDGIILSGSKFSVYEEHPWINKLKNLLLKLDEQNTPVFGICFGHQLIAETFGGKVERIKEYEYGPKPIYLTNEGKKDILYKDFTSRQEVIYSHLDYVTKLPSDSTLLAYSEMDKYTSFKRNKMWTVQYHPELTGKLLSKLMIHSKDVFLPIFNNDEHILEQNASKISNSITFGDEIFGNYIKSLIISKNEIT